MSAFSITNRLARSCAQDQTLSYRSYDDTDKDRAIHSAIGFSIMVFFIHVKSIDRFTKMVRLLLQSFSASHK